MASVLADPTTKREYLDLVARFPLIALESDEDLDAAGQVLDELIDRRSTWSPAEAAYFDALRVLVEAYENEHVVIPKASGVEVLEFLMEENGLTQSDVAGIMGTTQSVVSEILSGKRRLALPHVQRLSARFGVSADTLLG